MRSPRARATLPLLGAAALLAGCGDGASSTALQRDPVLRVEVSEYRITPQKLKVTEGRIKIVMTNTGKLPHNVKVVDRTRKDAGGKVEYGGTDTVPANGRAERVLRLFPGHYRLADTLGSNENLGTYGELYVVPRGSS